MSIKSCDDVNWVKELSTEIADIKAMIEQLKQEIYLVKELFIMKRGINNDGREQRRKDVLKINCS